MCNPTRSIRATNSTFAMRIWLTSLLCTTLCCLRVSAYPSELAGSAQRPLAVSDPGPSSVAQTAAQIVQAWRFNTTSASETRDILALAKVRAWGFDFVPLSGTVTGLDLTDSLEYRNWMWTFGASHQTTSTYTCPHHSSPPSYQASADHP